MKIIIAKNLKNYKPNNQVKVSFLLELQDNVNKGPILRQFGTNINQTEESIKKQFGVQTEKDKELKDKKRRDIRHKEKAEDLKNRGDRIKRQEEKDLLGSVIPKFSI